MSFSSDIKRELNKTNNKTNKELVKYELLGYLISSNTTIKNKKNLRFSTESDYNINRFSRLLSNINIEHDIAVNNKSFYITIKSKELEKIDFIEIEKVEESIYISQFTKEQLLEQAENGKALIRGAFLGAGSINNPENLYHLEISFINQENMEFTKNIIENFSIKMKELVSKNKYSLYLKDGEEISNFLALIGANKAVMKFEDIRIQKEMRGKVNRIVNCETANLNKTINAAIEQISAIKKLQKTGEFNKLDENLKEIAKLRLENPDISLTELGKMLKNPIGKSGVNYRLKKIMEIADEK